MKKRWRVVSLGVDGSHLRTDTFFTKVGARAEKRRRDAWASSAAWASEVLRRPSYDNVVVRNR